MRVIYFFFANRLFQYRDKPTKYRNGYKLDGYNVRAPSQLTLTAVSSRVRARPAELREDAEEGTDTRVVSGAVLVFRRIVYDSARPVSRVGMIGRSRTLGSASTETQPAKNPRVWKSGLSSLLGRAVRPAVTSGPAITRDSLATAPRSAVLGETLSAVRDKFAPSIDSIREN